MVHSQFRSAHTVNIYSPINVLLVHRCILLKKKKLRVLKDGFKKDPSKI